MRSRSAGFVVITGIYATAALLAISVFLALPHTHIFWRLLVADVAATIWVYLIGIPLKNASVYDPYWSMAPLVVVTPFAFKSTESELGLCLFLLAVWYWGIRLTCNWAHTFTSLTKEDWRYARFRTHYPQLFQIISLFGINLFPTAVVYLCLLPGVVFLQGSTCNALTLIGFTVCVGSTTLQLVADRQMHRFRHKNAGGNQIIRHGLWKHSRHPNYLGEILMWWGVYCFLLSTAPKKWYLMLGALINTLMFVFISIPMADKRNLRERPGFEQCVRQTRILLPLAVRKTSEPPR